MEKGGKNVKWKRTVDPYTEQVWKFVLVESYLNLDETLALYFLKNSVIKLEDSE